MRLNSAVKRARNHLDAFSHRISGWSPPADQIRWFFVATFPNGGSTALAQLLQSAKAATQLQERGEGQWLIEHMSTGQRWDADKPVDWAMVRALWLRTLRESGSFPCLVIEKSPPSMFRMEALRATFSDMPSSLVVYTRDPYAVCSSWAYRYNSSELNDPNSDPKRLFLTLGERYARMAKRLEELVPQADYTFSYEDLTVNTQEILSRLKSVEGWLHDIDMEAKLRVKDYEPQPLTNMNDRQIAKLSQDEVNAITQGLLPAQDCINSFGYELR